MRGTYPVYVSKQLGERRVMTPEEHRDLFSDSLGEWLEENGVKLLSTSIKPFYCSVDLNKLKLGMVQLIRAYGGNEQEPPPKDYYSTDYNYERDGWQDEH